MKYLKKLLKPQKKPVGLCSLGIDNETQKDLFLQNRIFRATFRNISAASPYNVISNGGRRLWALKTSSGISRSEWGFALFY